MATITALEAELTLNRLEWSFNLFRNQFNVEGFEVSFVDGHFYIGKNGKKVFFTEDVSDVIETFNRYRSLKKERGSIYV